MANAYVGKVAASKDKEAVDLVNELDALQVKKLWHQVGIVLRRALSIKFFQRAPRLRELADEFVRPFEDCLDPLIAAQLLVAASQQLADPSAELKYVHDGVNRLKYASEAVMLLSLQAAYLLLKKGEVQACHKELETVKINIDASPSEVDVSIQSRMYFVTMEYHKIKGTASQFFKNSLLFLSYTPLNAIPPQQQLILASDLGLAALVGEDIYNFGELLEHPIVQCLKETEFDWLHSMLFAFNRGQISEFESLFARHERDQAVLAKNGAMLRQKIRTMCLMEMVFLRASDDRDIAFDDIASTCEVGYDEVELLLMKAMSLEVIRGSIDQVEKSVRVDWVQPRVLGKEQIAALRDRLVLWQKQVGETRNFIETSAPELFA